MESGRRAAVAGLDGVLVVGAKNSSNSNRLVEVAQRTGADACLIDSAADIQPQWLEGRRRIGITAGASTPEALVEQVVSRLKDSGYTRVEEVEWIAEDVRFTLPPELKIKQTQ